MTWHNDRAVLRIYVAPDCGGCHTAIELAKAARRARPGHLIEVIDLADHTDAPLPAEVVGTPAYLLDGEVISLGNPTLDELLCRLDSAVSAGHDG